MKRNSGDERGLTIVELLVVVGIFAILGAMLLPVLARSRESGRRAACISNLKQMSTALKAYAEESPDNKYPPIANYYDYEVDCDSLAYNPVTPHARAVFFWNPEVMLPDYVTDPAIILCPSDRGWSTNDLRNPKTGQIDIFLKCYGPRGWNMLNGSYAYMGHVYDKMEDGPEYEIPIDEFRSGTNLQCPSAPKNSGVGAQLTAGLIAILNVPDIEQETLADNDYDLSAFEALTPGPIGNGNESILYRLREGVERMMITDTLSPGASAMAQSEIAIMWDQVSTLPSPQDFNHVPGGGNVLYLDGHVDFVEYPGSGPVSRASAVFSGCLKG